MASKSNLKTTPPDPMISSGQTLIPAIRRRRCKHRNPGIAVAFRLRGAHKKHSASNNSSPVNFWKGLQKNTEAEASARKLVAGLWQWRFLNGDVLRYSPSSKYQLANGNVKITFPHRRLNCGEKQKEIKDQQMKPITILRSRNGLRCELESSMQCLKCSKEEATKWNTALNNNEACNKFNMLHGMKHVEEKQIVGDCYFGVTNLLELLRAQRSINELKATQKSSKKRVEQFLQNLEDKRVSQKCRECLKIGTMLDNIKDKLAREKRSRERMELFNTKLVHELAKTKISAKQYMTNYKKEKRERKLIEEVCNELAMQVREDTAKLEVLLSDSVKICKEVEEEREMMEMAELWREERVQMKLADVQFLLEDKYNQMVQLIAFLQVFLRSRGAELDTTELEDAELIKRVVESVNIKRILELSYDFSKSDDTVSTFEELRKENTEEGKIKPCYSHTTLTSPMSTIYIENLDEELNESSILHHNSPSSDYNFGLEPTNYSLETIGYIEDRKFSSMRQRGDTYSVNVNYQDKDLLGSEKACLESLKTGVNGECSVSIGDLKRKVCLTSKQLRSCSNNGGITISSTKCSQHRRLGDDGWHKQKECNHRLPTSSIQCQGSVEGSFKHSELLEQGNSTYNNTNPHIIRGMRGCTEWPRGIPKSSFEVTPFGKERKAKNIGYT
ncbi:hypothetical protein JHK87_041961 [Glycine soja]|nr:hypothetical protein JHK87_041961 [Glycine soja]